MNLDDFITNEKGLITLESNQLKEINGGIGAPVSRIDYSPTIEDIYLVRYYENVRG